MKSILFTALMFIVLIVNAQHDEHSEIKINITIDSMVNVDTILHINQDMELDEIKEILSDIKMHTSELHLIKENILHQINDSVFDIDVNLDLKGFDVYLDSILSKELEHMDFDVEKDKNFFIKDINKHIVIKKSPSGDGNEQIIVIIDDEGNEKKLIYNPDNESIYQYYKDFDIEKEDPGAEK